MDGAVTGALQLERRALMGAYSPVVKLGSVPLFCPSDQFNAINVRKVTYASKISVIEGRVAMVPSNVPHVDYE